MSLVIQGPWIFLLLKATILRKFKTTYSSGYISYRSNYSRSFAKPKTRHLFEVSIVNEQYQRASREISGFVAWIVNLLGIKAALILFVMHLHLVLMFLRSLWLGWQREIMQAQRAEITLPDHSRKGVLVEELHRYLTTKLMCVTLIAERFRHLNSLNCTSNMILLEQGLSLFIALLIPLFTQSPLECCWKSSKTIWTLWLCPRSLCSSQATSISVRFRQFYFSIKPGSRNWKMPLKSPFWFLSYTQNEKYDTFFLNVTRVYETWN